MAVSGDLARMPALIPEEAPKLVLLSKGTVECRQQTSYNVPMVKSIQPKSLQQRILKGTDKLWTSLGGLHIVAPFEIGTEVHDCGPSSLYWVAPQISEQRIVEAFGFCADSWPYAGVTNKEFAITIQYLKLDVRYCGESETLGALLARKPNRCVALLPHHFIAILNGRIVGTDATMAWSPRTTVFCHWVFH